MADDVSLPRDAVMLLSLINTWLRDEYDSLEALCEDKNLDVNEIKHRLSQAGFEYNPLINQFR